MIKNEQDIAAYRKMAGMYFPVYVNAYMTKEGMFVEGNTISLLQSQVKINYNTWITDDGQQIYTVCNHKLDFSAN